MSQRIAQVTTAVLVKGVRTLIAPGQVLPAASAAAPALPVAMPEAHTPRDAGDKPGRKVVGA